MNIHAGPVWMFCCCFFINENIFSYEILPIQIKFHLAFKYCAEAVAASLDYTKKTNQLQSFVSARSENPPMTFPSSQASEEYLELSKVLFFTSLFRHCKRAGLAKN